MAEAVSVTAKELAAIEARYQRAFRRYETEHQTRVTAIRQAVAEGMRPVDVARITGVSRARIAQITKNSVELRVP